MIPRLLDLFCGAGGAGAGYAAAGFDVMGVDCEPQHNYPLDFVQADAFSAILAVLDGSLDVDAIHASPPCQSYSAQTRHFANESPMLIERTRELLLETGVPFVIEGVVGSPLRNPVQLCGTSFGHRLRRHRLFECHGFDAMVPPCSHGWLEDRYPVKTGRRRASSGLSRYALVSGRQVDVEIARAEMEMPWATGPELAEAIPPYYTEHIGGFLRSAVEAVPCPS